ncbi:MAG: PPOX class F420-dependent oxidoreductase [Ktedonobacterales bacterium]
MPLSEKARAFLTEQRFAVLATINADGAAQQTVMWYELRGDTILMNTAVGRIKNQNLRQEPRISICVSVGYTYVTISGTAQLIDDPQTAQADIRALAILNHGQEEGTRQSEEQFSKQQRVSIYLPIERVIAYGFED